MVSGATVYLSKHDSSVLSALFDPEASLQNSLIIRFDKSSDKQIDHSVVARRLERQALLAINEEQPSLSRIEKAIDDLSNIIATYPSYASAWNNRAQATRMLFDIADSPSNVSKIRSVYRDLTTAIDLSKPANTTATVSAESSAVLASAYTHRGYILWSFSRHEIVDNMLDAMEDLTGLDKARLEELASRDFSFGGRYGNEMAQQMAVKTNPYAKLCGSIVREAMQKEIAEYRQQCRMST